MSKHAKKVAALRAQLDKVVSGYDEVKDLIITCLLARGHVLLEAVPGTAKTTLVNTLQASIFGAIAARTQGTIDLKPTDILGLEVYNQKTQEFVAKLGDIIKANLYLLDEANRTTPKTLGALLQAMQELEVMIGGKKYPLEQLFMLLATRNPLESHGVFPMPEATMDRFAMLLEMDYVSFDHEVEMLMNTQVHGRNQLKNVTAEVTVEDLLEMRNEVDEICKRTTVEMAKYIVRLTRATRPGRKPHQKAEFDAVHGVHAKALRENIHAGASPRCEIWTLHCAAAYALIKGDEHIKPEHVKAVFPHVARARLNLSDAAIYDGVDVAETIQTIMDRVAINVA